MSFRFEGLEIWHKAREFSARIHEATVKFPRHEIYALTDQMNRNLDEQTQLYEWGNALARKINSFRNTLK